MWLINSSIGRKFVMAVTGVCLVLFVTFHVLMNSVAIFWPAAYNQVCEFLGANWYALVASIGLAALFIIHIIYALWLTFQNRAARGVDRYAVNARQPQVEWSSKNMLVLGIVVVAFLVVHLIQFWAKMQLVELRHAELDVLPQLNGTPVQPAMGTLFIEMAFKEIWTPIIYIIGFVALWFHMTHGFWSMFHTIGWDNNRWLGRLKCIANWWTTIVVGLFVIQAVVFTIQARNDYYSKDPALQAQYAESWANVAQETMDEFNGDIASYMGEIQNADPSTMTMEQRMEMQQKAQAAQDKFIKEKGKDYAEKIEFIQKSMEAQCPNYQVALSPQKLQTVAQLFQMGATLTQMLNMPTGNQTQPQ